jgi:hypothetical protein
MNIDLNNTIRSAVILVVGLPITVAVAAAGFVDATPADMRETTRVKAALTEGCVDYMVSKGDSKLERQGQDKIDEVLGADGANYKDLCGWVL